MTNTINDDLEKINELERKLSALTDPDEKETVLDDLIRITDKYPMELDPKSTNTGIIQDIHTIASLREQHLFKKMILLEQKMCDLAKQGNINDAREVEERMLNISEKWQQASHKSLGR